MVGTGWDGVNSLSCTATSAPAARARTSTTAPMIQGHLRRLLRRTAMTGPSAGSAPPTGAGRAGLGVEDLARPRLGSHRGRLGAGFRRREATSVSSDTGGARNPLTGAGATCSGGCRGAVRASAGHWPARPAGPRTRRRRAGRKAWGAAARASTSSRGPSASFGGRGWPTRAARVPIVVSVTKGTVPESAS